MALLSFSALFILAAQSANGKLAPHLLWESSIRSDDIAFSIHGSMRGLGIPNNSSNRLILLIAHDGRIVWSDDRVRGGQPFYCAKIIPTRVSKLDDEFHKAGFYDDPSLRRVHMGSESLVTTMRIGWKDGKLRMTSSHELAEADGNKVGLSIGILPLTRNSKLALLKKEPADWLYYRYAWSEVRSKLFELIPNSGLRARGNPFVVDSFVEWRADK